MRNRFGFLLAVLVAIVIRWLVLSLVIGLLLAGLPFNQACASQVAPITVVFRCDDYSSHSSTETELKIIDAFRQRDLRCSFMVIPNSRYDPIPPDKIGILNKALDEGAVDAGLHGFTHKVLQTPYSSEFRGVYYREQEHRIAEGKAMLELWTARRITVFAPPYDSYDLDTVSILEKHGFTCLAASLGGDALASSKIKMLPVLCNLGDVRHEVELARKAASGTPTMVIAITHAHEIADKDPRPDQYSFVLLTSTLDWLKEQKDVRVLSISQALETIPDLDSARFLANKSLFNLSFDVPTFLCSYYPAGVYFTAERAHQVWRQWVAYLVLFYSITTIVPAIFAFACAAFVFPGFPRLRWVFLALATVIFLIAFDCGFRSLFQGYHTKLATTVIFGVCLGLWLGWLKVRRRPAASA